MARTFNVARPIAPEDLQKDMFVAVLSVTHEMLPFFCDSTALLSRSQPFRISWLPNDDDTQPFKIVSICLPFVFVKNAQRCHRTLDVRRHRLAQISNDFGRNCFESSRRVEEKR